MKGKSYLITLIIFFAACNRPQHTSKPSNIKPHNLSFIGTLKAKKGHIDSLKRAKERLIVLVKLANNNQLQIIKKGLFPDSVETTYNILKDNLGRIIYIMESPYSESGDWNIEYKNYFDTNGQLFSFERIAGFFNSECTTDTDDPAHEKLVEYFDRNEKLVDSVYTLMDNNKNPLKRSSCTFNYDFPYKIIHRLKDYLKANKIDLTQ